MDNIVDSTPIATASATPSVAPTPTPSVAPTPTPTPMGQPNVQMAEGGSTLSGEGGAKSFFQSLNWVEVGFSILGVAALSYVIFYYRFKITQDKLINNELQRQIDEIKMNLQTKMQGKYKTI